MRRWRKGLRVTKTVNGVVTTYYYQGSLLIAEETNSQILVYLYDANGSPVGFRYRGVDYASGTWDTYAYEKNLQGDIVGVYDVATGNKLIGYKYNAWGVCTTSYYNSGSTTTATKNPFKYRGYYYDVNLGFYYLQSRYYDPVIGRFLNADDTSYLGANGDLVSYNLYAYCSNNPVNYTDPTGKFINILIGASVGFVVSTVVSIASQLLDENAPDIDDIDFWKHVAVAAGIGTISGGLAASGAPLIAQVISNGVLGIIGAVTDTAIDDKGDTPWWKYVLNGVDGGLMGCISGYIGGSGSASKHTTNSFWRFVGGKSNFSYYFSQIKNQAISDGIDAIPSIFKASAPAVLKLWLKYEYQKHSGE